MRNIEKKEAFSPQTELVVTPTTEYKTSEDIRKLVRHVIDQKITTGRKLSLETAKEMRGFDTEIMPADVQIVYRALKFGINYDVGYALISACKRLLWGQPT